MTVIELVNLLEKDDSSLHIMLPSGAFIPAYFHITEVGKIQKTFIDCGGTRRELVSCMLQVWTANDTEHRLTASKLLKILKMADFVIRIDGSWPVEFEYGENGASQFVVSSVETTPAGLLFVLAGKQTDCLAPDKCGINQCKDGKCC